MARRSGLPPLVSLSGRLIHQHEGEKCEDWPSVSPPKFLAPIGHEASSATIRPLRILSAAFKSIGLPESEYSSTKARPALNNSEASMIG